MKKLVLLLSTVFVTQVFAKENHALKIEPLPLDLEMQLALSSMPDHLHKEATLYRLDPKYGFKVVRRGSNGMHAFVARYDVEGLKMYKVKKYSDDFLVPISFDTEGAKTIMPYWFQATRLAIAGVSPKAVTKIIKKAFDKGWLKAPARAGISYMISPILRAYGPPSRGELNVGTINMPHYMFYAPNVTNKDIGAKMISMTHPFVPFAGPHGYIIKAMSPDERAKRTWQYVEMLGRLCKFRKSFCLPNLNPNAGVYERLEKLPAGSLVNATVSFKVDPKKVAIFLKGANELIAESKKLDGIKFFTIEKRSLIAKNPSHVAFRFNEQWKREGLLKQIKSKHLVVFQRLLVKEKVLVDAPKPEYFVK